MKKRAVTLVTIAQSIFLSLKLFFQNGLLSYSSACSFDLIFSVIPVFLMVILVAVRILHASPELVSSIYNAVPELQKYLNINEALASFRAVKLFSTLELVLVLFIIWMARRLFASVFAALRNIFHDQQKRRALLNQALVFVFELIFVSIIVAFIFAYMAIKAVIKLPFFQRFPQLNFIYNSILTGNALSYIPNILLFVVITLMYKIGSGTKPRLLLCIATGFLCTASFWIFRTILHTFINISRYNLIYGVLSNVVIMLMDLFFFFVFFLFFAQYIFVIQFFDELLLGELYLLPKSEDRRIGSRLRRSLFIRPDFLLANPLALKNIPAGETLYKEGDTDTFVYYILNGCVKVSRSEFEEEKIYIRGDFFGELNSILVKPRTSSATAATNSQIIRIKSKRFRFIIKSNPEAAQKVLAQLSEYLSNLHSCSKNAGSQPLRQD